MIQIEALAREKSESEKVALQQLVMELEEQMVEERLARERQNHESISQHGSNSRHQVSPRPEEAADESQHNAQGEEDNCTNNEDYDLSDGDMNHQRNAAAPLVPTMNNTSIPSVDDAHRYAHDALVGKDVILYAMLRSQPVAKGTILSTNPNTIVGGQPVGKQFCEVIVNVVLKRDAMLPRPYDNMESMAGAYI